MLPGLGGCSQRHSIFLLFLRNHVDIGYELSSEPGLESYSKFIVPTGATRTQLGGGQF